ncbi:putative transposase [Gordonia araii NBRC 100433]|uniref:Putative transposase n=1 Tax=Gordonia araii NBRC 100433 TaxID=1073574 RepID=G7GZW3_9ACTN|nr:putative transposase [Gordonia araii NBRC 100433]
MRHTHHLGLGITNAGKRVLAITDETSVTVIDLETNEALSTHHIDPTKNYWRNTRRAPGRWPGAPT